MSGIPLIGGPQRCEGPLLDGASNRCHNPAVCQGAAPGVPKRWLCPMCSLLFRMNYAELQLKQHDGRITNIEGFLSEATVDDEEVQSNGVH